jgi:dolichyl-phosphate-mannose--protein O-mannosyl transferase
MLIGTPAMWWLSLPALAWGAWRSFVRLDWRYAAVGVGYLAGLLPWFLNIDRQMYFFYMTPAAPFLVLLLVLILGEVLGRYRAGHERRRTGVLVLSLYVGMVVANFAWLWPILNGVAITNGHWNSELWLPSWQ